jgi:hypothetical protein
MRILRRLGRVHLWEPPNAARAIAHSDRIRSGNCRLLSGPCSQLVRNEMNVAASIALADTSSTMARLAVRATRAHQ